MERNIYENDNVDFDLSGVEEPKNSRMPKTADELLDYFEKNTSYEPIQERIEKSKVFIAQVIKFTKDLGIEVKIVEKDNCIVAKMPLLILGLELYCKSAFEYLIHIADELAFFSKDNVPEMHLTYYTHETYLNGRALHRLKEKDATQ